jgi:hypothetical protein
VIYRSAARLASMKASKSNAFEGPLLLALDQRAAQRLEPRLVLLQELQRRPHDLARGAVAACRNLPLDEPDEALVEGDRGALRHHEPPRQKIPLPPGCW